MIERGVESDDASGLAGCRKSLASRDGFMNELLDMRAADGW